MNEVWVGVQKLGFDEMNEYPMSNKGYIHLNSWAGKTKHPIKILKETPKRFKVELLEDCLKGKAGKVLYAPKYAITFDNSNDIE